MAVHKNIELKDLLAPYYEQFYDRERYFNGTSPNVQLFVDNTEEELGNIYYWMENYSVDDLPTPLNPNTNSASYDVLSTVQRMASMMDIAAPHSETNQRYKGEHESFTSTIPRFNVGDYENAMSLMQVKNFAERYGNADKVMEKYKITIEDIIKAGHATLSRMAAQEQSEGKIEGWGKLAFANPLTSGMHADQFHIPDEDLQDTSTELLTWIEDFVSDLDDTYADRYDWVLQVSDDWLKDVFMKNEQVISEVGAYVTRLGNGTTVILQNTSGNIAPAPVGAKNFTWEDCIAYSQTKASRIPPIEVQIENQNEETATGQVNGRGWKTANIAFKPVGKSGVIKWGDIVEFELAQAFGADTVTSTYAYAINGMMGIMNSIVPEGTLKGFHTDAYLMARPQLTDFLYRHIVYTDQTQS